MRQVGATESGLTDGEAQRRLTAYGANTVAAHHRNQPLTILFRQFLSPLVIILLGAAALSLALGQA
jgi:Mg2+-importing ATPase